jgi:hypothetical protein
MPDQPNVNGGVQGLSLVRLWPWILFPLLPLWMALLVLHLLYDDVFQLARFAEDAVFIDQASRHFIHLRDLLVYAAFACLHAIICALVLVYLVLQLHSLPETTRRAVWRLSLVLLILLVATTVVARHAESAQLLTYANVCEMLIRANASADLLPEECVGGPPSLLFALATFPTVTGIIAALFAVGVASTARAPIEAATESEWRAEFSRRSQVIHRAFYAASAVLVTSMVTIKLFLELPVALTADETTRQVVSYSAQGMTIFWGMIFTLTLVAVFAPAAYCLYRALAEHGLGQEASSELQDWLNHQILHSVPKKVAGVVAFLAPLLVGPTTEVLNRLIG